MQETAKKLHDQIFLELKQNNFDTFARSGEDKFLLKVVQSQNDATLRRCARRIKIKGLAKNLGDKNSLVASDQFCSSYWRGWKSQHEVLENMSSAELLKVSMGCKTKEDRLGQQNNGFSSRTHAQIGESFLKNMDFTSVKYLYSYQRDQNLSSAYIPPILDQYRALPGGLMARGPARASFTPPVTMNCTFPKPEELISQKRKNCATVITSSPRFPALQKLAPEPIPSASNKPKSDLLDSPGNKFGSEQKFSRLGLSNSSTPGPGTYKIPRIFENINHAYEQRLDASLQRALMPQSGLKSFDTAALISLGVFAYGCNLDEHVRYGMCLDGKCAQRSSWETAAVRDNEIGILEGDQERLKEIEAASKRKINYKDLRKNAELRMELKSGKSKLDFSPMELAAYLGDVDTMKKQVAQGADINKNHKASKGTCLHIVVSRQLTQTVRGMMEEKKALKLKFEVFDSNGDTPIHIAARRGYLEIVELLCDGGADPRTPSRSGTLCMAESRTHAIYQVLHITAQKRQLEEELHTLKANRPPRNRNSSSLRPFYTRSAHSIIGESSSRTVSSVFRASTSSPLRGIHPPRARDHLEGFGATPHNTVPKAVLGSSSVSHTSVDSALTSSVCRKVSILDDEDPNVRLHRSSEERMEVEETEGALESAEEEDEDDEEIDGEANFNMECIDESVQEEEVGHSRDDDDYQGCDPDGD